MKEKVSKKFQEIYGSGAVMFASPGRINLIGEHTDYNGRQYLYRSRCRMVGNE